MTYSRTPVPLARVQEMQGFDGTVAALRNVYFILNWNVGRVRRTYNLSLIFDGDQRGLGGVLLDFEGSAVCVGRGVVSVGVDDLVSLTFARRIDTDGQSVRRLLSNSRQIVSLERHVLEPNRFFGPFSSNQQLYAAGDFDAPGVSLYGFRARWEAEGSTVEERCFLLQARTPADAITLLYEHFADEYAAVDIRQVVLEIDDTRLETIVSDFSLFTTSRVSQLDEHAYIKFFRLGAIVEP